MLVAVSGKSSASNEEPLKEQQDTQFELVVLVHQTGVKFFGFILQVRGIHLVSNLGCNNPQGSLSSKGIG